MGFGRELQDQRVSRGIELEAIATGTKVSLRHLRALEEEQLAELPGGIFNRGILRSYCRFVGLDEAPWMQRFGASSLGAAEEPDWEEFADNVRRNRPAQGLRSEHRWGGVVLMVFAFVLFAWCAWRVAIQPRVHGEAQSRSTASTQPQPDSRYQ